MKTEIHQEDQVLPMKKECRICGDAARGLNFNVLTCVPCKNFFRRNAYKKCKISICQFDNNCSITKRTRGYCSSCRLKKCLAFGMDPELIRIIPGSIPVSKKLKLLKKINNKQCSLPTPVPLGLLQNDRSKLTSNEWTLLSNILHVHEEHIPMGRMHHTVNYYSSLPPKLRLKPSEIVNIIRDMFTSIGPLLKNSPHFAFLPDSSRRVVTKNNLYMAGSLNGLFLCRELVPPCPFENNCNITKKTRSHCSTCRLKKCFALGMDPALMKNLSNGGDIAKIVQNETAQLPTPSSISLLRNDRSMLTNYEWNLLSKFIHAFDQQNISSKIQSSLYQLSLRPPKLRLRSSETYHMVAEFFTSVQSIIERSSDLCNLSVDTRRALTKQNLSSIGAFNGIFLCRELDLYNNSIFFYASCASYGTEFLLNCSRNSARCDPNGNLIKVMLFVLNYSSNCSIVTFDDKKYTATATAASMCELIQIQNLYVTVLWKYLVYLYGFKEATLRYCSLVKSILDVTHMLELMPKNETHELMIEAITIETQHIQLIKD